MILREYIAKSGVFPDCMYLVWDENADSYNKRKKSAGFCMKAGKGPGISGILILFLLPYLLTVIICGREACPVSRESDMEDYLPAVTASQISWDAPSEAIKAQTIIARNNLYLEWKRGTAANTIQTASQAMKRRKMDDLFLEQFQKFQDAAADTRGQVLMKAGEVVELPYHELSQGKTRDAMEVLGESFSYSPSVETPEDINSPSYIQGCYFSLDDLKKQIRKSYPGFIIDNIGEIEIKNMDSAGYVLEINVGNQEFQGEKIRDILHLPSSCFTVQTLESEVRFLCKGIGHGVGLSQYTAEKMAGQKKKYEEILHYFFPDLKMKKI